MGTIFLLIMAVAPGLLIAFFIYLKDYKSPLPKRSISKAFIFGILSFFIAIAIGLFLEKYAHINPRNYIHQMIRALIFIGLAEEASKFLFVRGILYRDKNFTKPFDGIVFAVMVGMGFATAENVLYVLNGDGGTAIVRMFTAVPAHAVFAVIMGFFIGEAKVFSSSSRLYNTMALLFATMAHGYYDFFLFLSFVPGMWWHAIVALVVVILFTQYAFNVLKDEIIEHE